MSQIELTDKAPQLETLYGLGAMTDDQKKAAVGAVAGIMVGVALFLIIKNARKKARR